MNQAVIAVMAIVIGAAIFAVPSITSPGAVRAALQIGLAVAAGVVLFLEIRSLKRRHQDGSR